MFALTGTARADLMFTDDFNFSVNISKGTTNLSQTLQFTEFDSSLGTLTGVQFDLESFAQTSGTIFGQDKTNPSSGAVNVSGSLAGTLEMDVTVLGSGAELTSPTALSYSGGCSKPAGPAPGSCFDVFTPTTTFDGSFMVDAGDLALFIGGGTFDVDLLAAFTLTCTAGPTDTCVHDTLFKWSGTELDPIFGVKVTYTFDPVPEPGTLALFGVGLFGLALFHQRRRRRGVAPPNGRARKSATP